MMDGMVQCQSSGFESRHVMMAFARPESLSSLRILFEIIV
jgi:hypothetical protein